MAAVTMQTQRTCLAGQTLQTTSSRVVASRVCRPVVARASAEETRRAVLGGLLAGAVALTPLSASAIEIVDATKVRDAGFDLIYQARDLSLPQNVRDGIEQFRSDIDASKSRIAESKKRIDSKLDGLIQKQYWTQAREELRGQVGNLRQDIGNLSNKLAKDQKKQAQALNKDFEAKISDLDFAFRKKSPEKAAAAYAAVKTSLDTLLSTLG